MTRRLRALLVEDSEADAGLLLLELRRQGYELESERVEDAKGLKQALDSQPWDVVLSDWSMPHFDALAALTLVRERGLDLPFIIVSGTIGEETAVEALHAGATDYLVKGTLTRLRTAIERALEELEVRRAKRKAELAFEASNLRFKRLWEAGIIGVTVAETSGTIVEANDQFLAMVGYSQDDLARGALNWAEMTPREFAARDAQAKEELGAQGFARPWEKEYFRKDGSRVSTLIAVATLEASKNIAITLDLSERKRLEEQFRQAQKMEAIGRLAGSIAHDFNNLLSVILGYAGLALDTLDEGDPLWTELEQVARAGERAAELTRHLLAFSRKQMLKPRVLDLKQVTWGMETMLQRLLGDDVQLTILATGETGRVYADPSQLEQIIMNLAVNARDAMPAGGKLVIETGSADIDTAYVADHIEVTPGAYVTLAVTDTGMGMDPETRARIFEPFFTTKEQGKGTGLGLSTVYGIVRQSGGHICVYSEVGIGTTFKVYLPSRDAVVETAASEPTVPPDTLRGCETILLVEDQRPVRAMVRTVLERQGYKVLEAEDGAAAGLISEEFPGDIHLLLTDVVMPRLSGRAVAEQLTRERPQMRVLYMSGYTEDSMSHRGMLDEGVAFLQKPVTPDALARKVREVLNGTSEGSVPAEASPDGFERQGR